MTRQISHKIEAYQLERLVEERVLAHHSINILSKGGSHFELKKLEGCKINGEEGKRG